MRNLIDIISKTISKPVTATSQTLLEGKHFEAMFAAVEELGKRYHQNSILEEVQDCKNIVQSLKRNDRQAWAARILRLYLTDNLIKWTISSFETPAEKNIVEKKDSFAIFKSEVTKLDSKYRSDYLKTVGVNWSDEKNNTDFEQRAPSVIKRLIVQHYLGMPYSKIQNYTFSKSITQTLADLETLETEYRERAKGLLSLQEGDKIIIRMPDNFVWVMLSRGYCPDEANAMGHCGNAGARSGDHILSLRRIKDVLDGVALMEPCLTFILDANGQLGEMKGRGNEKPAAHYHEQIITLLRNPIVKGIKGGGYMPRNNFSMMDLPDDVREKLTDSHPHLGNWQSRYEKAVKTGEMTKTFKTELVAAVKENVAWSRDVALANDSEVTVYQWSSITELVDEMSDDDHTKEVASGDYNIEYHESPSDDGIENFMNSLPVQYQMALGQAAVDQMREDGEDDEIDDFDMSNTREVLSKLDEQGSEYKDALISAVSTGNEFGAQKESHELLVSAIRTFKPALGRMEFPTYENSEGEKDWAWNSPVKLVVTIKQACKLIDSAADVDEFEGEDDLKQAVFPDEELKINQPYYGYSDFDEDVALDTLIDMVDFSNIERKPDQPDFSTMDIKSVKRWIETMYDKIPDGFIRKVHTDTLSDDRIRASAKGLFKKYYG